MALMFRSVLQNAGGAAELIVTCDSEFAGATISCSDGITTLNKTCPVSSPYEVTFKIPNSGDWTISATVSGTTYSSDPISVDLDYSTVLEYGFNWRRWVDTAQYLDSTDYSTLSDLLADEEAVRELCLEHACVDYLCNGATVTADLVTVINNDLFAKWVNNSDYALDKMYANAAIKTAMDSADKYGYGEWCLMPQVPTMTANNAPYGEAIGSSIYNNNSNYTYFKAFDGVIANGWAATAGLSAWIGYKFVEAVEVRKIRIKGHTATPAPTGLVQYSDDNITWSDTDSTFTITGAEQDVDVKPYGAHLYWRVYQTSTNSNETYNTYLLQFYAYAPKGNVPVMTSNNAPYGEVIESSHYQSYSGYRAFDDNDSTEWVCQTDSTGFIGYKSVNPINVKRVKIIVPYSSDIIRVRGYKIQASNDNSTWVDLYTGEVANDSTNSKVVIVDIDNNSNYYLYHRIYVTSTWVTATVPIINTLQFYGRELSVSVPKMDTNTTPYGEAISNNASIVANNYKVFDNTNSGSNDHVQLDNTTSNNSRIGYDFGKPTCIKFIWGRNRADVATRSVKEFKIQGSNDATTWEDITPQALTNANNTANAIFVNKEIANNKAYRYIALLALEGTNNDHEVWIGQLQFFGVDYSEKEFEEGTNKKWLYDHGLELVAMDGSYASAATTTISATKEDSQIYYPNSGSANITEVFGISAPIDLTPYNLIRIVDGNKGLIAARYALLLGMKLKDFNVNISGNAQYFQLLITSMGTPHGVDISSVNQESYIGVTSGYNCAYTFTELWLE